MYSQNSISFAPLSLKIYKITSTKSYSLSLLLKECAPIFFPSTFFSFDFIWILIEFFFLNIQLHLHCNLNITKPPQMHPYPPRAFQWYNGTKSTGREEEGYSTWEISTLQNKTNKQTTYKLLPSLINVTHSICNGKVRLGGDHYLGNWISKQVPSMCLRVASSLRL
jgi:hypothetical protein